MARILFWIARSRLGRCFVQWGLAYMSFLLPVQRLHETATLIAFHHPRPSYPLHILLVPKRSYASLLDIPPEATDFLGDLLAITQTLVREFNLQQGGYRLITNGGAYQDIPHLHFHLVSDVPAALST